MAKTQNMKTPALFKTLPFRISYAALEVKHMTADQQSTYLMKTSESFRIVISTMSCAISAFTGLVGLPVGAQSLPLGPLIELSQPNPVAGCDDGFSVPGKWTVNDATEPFVAVNPVHPNNMVVAWILGPFQNVIAGVSFNGGQSWQQVPIPFSLCSGGPYLATGDPRLAFAPNGDLYAFGVTAQALATRGVSLSKSTDGGLHWSPQLDLPGNTYAPNDLPTVTHDPADAHFVYAIWDGTDTGHRGPAVFSRTTDGGLTWEPSRAILQTTPQDYVQFSQILVLPNGTLVDLFEFVNVKDSGHGIQQTFSLELMRSTDRGLNWSGPALATTMLPLYGGPVGNSVITDPDTGQLVQDPINPSFALDSKNGSLYAVWEDGRFSNFQYNDIAFSMSSDGGTTWSIPTRINRTPLNIAPLNRQAFLPAIAVLANGTIGVSYYDFRFNDSSPGVPTDRWLVLCQPSATTPASDPANWYKEVRLTSNSFDLEACKLQGTAFFVGDYMGLAAAGNSFVAVFTQPDQNSVQAIFARRVSP
jgi:hypothetical protein